jgi:hypothetical protein
VFCVAVRHYLRARAVEPQLYPVSPLDSTTLVGVIALYE